MAIVQAALIILRLINQGTLRLFHELKLGELGEINIFCQPQPRTTSTIAAASFSSTLLAHFSHPLNFVSSEQKLLKSWEEIININKYSSKSWKDECFYQLTCFWMKIVRDHSSTHLWKVWDLCYTYLEDLGLLMQIVLFN